MNNSGVYSMVKWIKNNTSFIYLFLVIGKAIGLISDQLCFILGVIALFFIIVKKKRIFIPHINGLWSYFLYAILLVIIGLSQYTFRNVVRDMYYVFPTIIFVLLGYYIQLDDCNDTIIKSVIVAGFIVPFISIIKTVFSIGLLRSLVSIRSIFTNSCYEMVVSLIVIYTITILDIDIINKKYKKCIFLLLCSSIILSFSRSAWIEAIAAIIVITIIVISKKGTSKELTLVTKLFFALLAIIIVSFLLLPNAVINEYMEKIFRSSEEINSDTIINSFVEATENWRAYEIQCALSTWKNGSWIEKIFGYGFGKGIHIYYVPAAWQSSIENNEIPLLHSGYHTYLVKGGIIGLLSLIFFMSGSIVNGVRYYKINDIKVKMYSLILLGISLALIIQTYVVRGPIVQNVNISWTMLIGWISGYLYRQKLYK